MQIATFDFHNTVAYCDPWFQLEIRELPAGVLEIVASQTGAAVTDAHRAEATARYRALRQGIMEHGVEVDALDSVDLVLREMGVDADRAAIAMAIDRLMRQALHHLEPVPGAVDSISKLIDAGIPVGVISSAVYHPFVEWSLMQFGLLERLRFVATSASIGYYKSDTRIYRHAYEAARACVELGVHVGDSPKWDIDMAKQAGLAAVLYDEPGKQRATRGTEDLATPDLVLESLVGADRPLLELLAERRAGTFTR